MKERLRRRPSFTERMHPRTRRRAMTASAIALLGVVGTLTLQWLVPKVFETASSAVSDEARRQRPVDVAVATDLIEFQRVSLTPRAYVVPRTPREIIAEARRQETYDAYDPAWKYAMGGVDAYYTEVQLVVQGRDETPVILQGVEVDVVERREPLTGVLIQEPGGDLVDVRYIAVDLDPTQPKVSLGSGFTPGEGEWKFPLSVSSTEAETLYIFASTDACHCSWNTRIHFTYRGEAGSLQIDNAGAPFRTTAVGNVTQSYSIDADAPGLDKAD